MVIVWLVNLSTQKCSVKSMWILHLDIDIRSLLSCSLHSYNLLCIAFIIVILEVNIRGYISCSVLHLDTN